MKVNIFHNARYKDLEDRIRTSLFTIHHTKHVFPLIQLYQRITLALFYINYTLIQSPITRRSFKFIMLSASYLVFGLAFLAPLISADGTASTLFDCSYSSKTNKVDPSEFDASWRSFCRDQESQFNGSSVANGKTVGKHNTFFSFTGDRPGCHSSDCVQAFEQLVNGCSFPLPH